MRGRRRSCGRRLSRRRAARGAASSGRRLPAVSTSRQDGPAPDTLGLPQVVGLAQTVGHDGGTRDHRSHVGPPLQVPSTRGDGLPLCFWGSGFPQLPLHNLKAVQARRAGSGSRGRLGSPIGVPERDSCRLPPLQKPLRMMLGLKRHLRIEDRNHLHELDV